MRPYKGRILSDALKESVEVFCVSSLKAADLRRFLSRHAKSNGIDADTLARLPLSGAAGLRPRRRAAIRPVSFAALGAAWRLTAA